MYSSTRIISLHLFLPVQAELCIAFGPGVDMVDSTRIIGENQYYFARVCSMANYVCITFVYTLYIVTQTLLGNASNILSGLIDYRHTYVDMTKLTVTLENGRQVWRNGVMYTTVSNILGPNLSTCHG